MPAEATEERSIPKQLTQGSEKSIGEKAPGAPFMLVGLSFLTILILGCVAMVAFMYLAG